MPEGKGRFLLLVLRELIPQRKRRQISATLAGLIRERGVEIKKANFGREKYYPLKSML